MQTSLELTERGPAGETQSNSQGLEEIPSEEKDPSHRNTAEEVDDDDDDDDVTVIVLDGSSDNHHSEMLSWIERAGPEMEERRRNVILRELRRVQRSSFVHFGLLCLIPTVLLLVVIVIVMGDEEECISDVTFCELEPRSFVTAFTTRCICDAIPVDVSDRDSL